MNASDGGTAAMKNGSFFDVVLQIVVRKKRGYFPVRLCSWVSALATFITPPLATGSGEDGFLLTVVIIADLICAAVADGIAPQSSAAAPDTNGAAILVPLMVST